MLQLRDYQKKLVNRIYEEAKKGNKKILLLAPTGSGKTVMAKCIIDSCLNKGNRALFTVPRINLIDQTAKYFDDYSILQADDPRFDISKNLQIAMIQTLLNREINAPNIVIIDEIHYSYDGKLIQSIFERFPNAIFIGLSATPVDDNGYLLDGFDAYIDDYQMKELIDENWLVPVDSYSCLNLDLSNVNTNSSWITFATTAGSTQSPANAWGALRFRVFKVANDYIIKWNSNSGNTSTGNTTALSAYLSKNGSNNNFSLSVSSKKQACP